MAREGDNETLMLIAVVIGVYFVFTHFSNTSGTGAQAISQPGGSTSGGGFFNWLSNVFTGTQQAITPPPGGVQPPVTGDVYASQSPYHFPSASPSSSNGGSTSSNGSTSDISV